MRDIFAQRYTRAQIGAMCQMRREGYSNIKIAKAFGCSKSWVGRVFTYQRRKDDIMMLMAEFQEG